MKTFKSHLKETTLSRVFRHFQNKKIPVGIITAFRDEFEYGQNVKRNKVLASKIKKARYGFVYVDGHWKEKDKDTGELVDVNEDSILVVGSENDSGKLKGLFKKWVKLDLRSKIPLQKCYMDNNSTVWRGDIGR